jgi:hypothetical protein
MSAEPEAFLSTPTVTLRLRRSAGLRPSLRMPFSTSFFGAFAEAIAAVSSSAIFQITVQVRTFFQ